MIAHAPSSLQIQEQTVEDPVTGFTVKFIVAEGSDHPSRVLFKGRADTLWREFMFDQSGDFCGATTRVAADASPQLALRLVK